MMEGGEGVREKGDGHRPIVNGEHYMARSSASRIEEENNRYIYNQGTLN